MKIIPLPEKYIPQSGKCNLQLIESCIIDSSFDDIGLRAFEELKKAFPNIKTTATASIAIYCNRVENIAMCGYILDICSDKIVIQASTGVGLLYGIMSFLMQTNYQLDGLGSIDCWHIEDKPAMEWRGIMLDESRHFWGKEIVKSLLDTMCSLKLNVFHWHLTDDVGWRIEIKKYPLLTQIGSQRSGSQVGSWIKGKNDNIPYGGYYTQEDIKEIVEYARLRGIMVVPEIDMPAHFAAAFASYKWLACRETDVEVPWYLGAMYPLSQGIKDWNRSACIGKPSTMQFIYDVIDEICELFPAPYFHIGGDEAPMGEWKTCPHCQQLMKDKGLKTTKELLGYFTNCVQDHCLKKGKSLIGWNEVLGAGNLDRSVIGQYWTPIYDPNVKKHLSQGGKIIISRHTYFYFDMPYSRVKFKKTYSFRPMIDFLPKKYRPQILGAEGTIWTEWIYNTDKLYFQIFPRLFALAEVTWNQGKKDYKFFLKRMDNQVAILDNKKINSAKKHIWNCTNHFVAVDRERKWNFDTDVEYKINK